MDLTKDLVFTVIKFIEKTQYGVSVDEVLFFLRVYIPKNISDSQMKNKITDLLLDAEAKAEVIALRGNKFHLPLPADGEPMSGHDQYQIIQIGSESVLHQVVEMKRDGACLYRSISYLIYGTQEFHETVRTRIVQHVIDEWEFFQFFTQTVAGTFYKDQLDYAETMLQLDYFGTTAEVQAGGNVFQVMFEVFEEGNRIYGTSEEKYSPNSLKLQFSGERFRGHFNVLLKVEPDAESSESGVRVEKRKHSESAGDRIRSAGEPKSKKAANAGPPANQILAPGNEEGERLFKPQPVPILLDDIANEAEASESPQPHVEGAQPPLEEGERLFKPQPVPSLLDDIANEAEASESLQPHVEGAQPPLILVVQSMKSTLEFLVDKY